MIVGVISDTHGLVRPEALAALVGVEHIVHAGDIGPVDILDELAAIAPVTAVWGNVDGMEIRARVPEVARLELGGVRIAIVHGMQFGSPTPQKVAAAHPDAGLVVFGHSHRPLIQQVGPTLAVNPGSAGPRRFKDPVTVAITKIENGTAEAHLVSLLPQES